VTATLRERHVSGATRNRAAGLIFPLAALLLGIASSSVAAESKNGIAAVEAIGITVRDMDAARDFYTRVLPFEVVAEDEISGTEFERLFGVFGLRAEVLRLRLGEEFIELIDFIAPEGRPIPMDSRSNDEWFQHIAIIVSDMDAAYAHLREHDVTHASPAPQRLPDWNENAGGIEAFYFRDPDGNHLELLEFPPDKGDPRWHAPTAALFLGIDHTAIVVRDTEEALRFYRDGLGLSVMGASENYGIEQERLNNVFGARLRITALGSPEGPAIEFLEYLAPPTGRPMPVDTQANDLWHWHIRMRSPSLDGLSAQLMEHGGTLVSPGVIALPDDAEFPSAVHVRGPTGHAVLIHEAARAATQE
jgi:catechol 2,3-dioxygenase-like lactoylglutathione lyase family enzyme